MIASWQVGRWLMILLVCSCSQIALAQETLAQETSGCGTNPKAKQVIQETTLAQAEDELTQFLFSTIADVEIESISAVVARSDCLLQAQSSLFPIIDGFRPALLALGMQASSAESGDEVRRAREQIQSTVNRDAGTGFIELPGEQGSVQISLYGEVLNQSCSPEASSRCGQALELSKSLWQIAGEFQALSDQLNTQDKLLGAQTLTELEMQWRSYKDDSIKLWPQEVLLNSVFFKLEPDGLSAPPARKLLALRPSLGLSYLSDTDHRIQPTLNLDLLGVYWWRYEGTKALPGRGLALSAIYDGDDTAIGLSYYHSPKWSFTVASGDENDLVVSLSFQLAYVLF